MQTTSPRANFPLVMLILSAKTKSPSMIVGSIDTPNVRCCRRYVRLLLIPTLTKDEIPDMMTEYTAARVDVDESL